MERSPHADRFAEIIGAANVLTDPADQAPYLTEWRDLYQGVTPMVLRPGNTAEVGAVMAYAYENGLKIVPQGGNTGLVGGQIPQETGDEIVLSLSRLNKIRAVDPAGFTLIAEAGVVLETLQNEAEKVDRLFPLALGAPTATPATSFSGLKWCCRRGRSGTASGRCARTIPVMI